MEARQPNRAHAAVPIDSIGHPARQCVLTWGRQREGQPTPKVRLSAADKLAWEFLWVSSRGGRQQVATDDSEIAAYQGTTRGRGLARLKNLAAAGLVSWTPQSGPYGPRTGGVLVSVHPDPREVYHAQTGVVWDPQGTFAFLTDGDLAPGSAANLDGGILATDSPAGLAALRLCRTF